MLRNPIKLQSACIVKIKFSPSAHTNILVSQNISHILEIKSWNNRKIKIKCKITVIKIIFKFLSHSKCYIFSLTHVPNQIKHWCQQNNAHLQLKWKLCKKIQTNKHSSHNQFIESSMDSTYNIFPSNKKLLQGLLHSPRTHQNLFYPFSILMIFFKKETQQALIYLPFNSIQ